jgi:Protein of unknown function (DUF669)
MAKLSDLNMSNVKPLPEKTIPAGEYVATIASAQIMNTKTGNGEKLQLQWKIAAGEHTGRVIYDNLNLWNKSAEASDIAKSQWAAISQATTGKTTVKELKEVLGKPVIITVGTQEDLDGGRRNKVVYHKDSIRPFKQAAAATTTPAAVPANQNKPAADHQWPPAETSQPTPPPATSGKKAAAPAPAPAA